MAEPLFQVDFWDQRARVWRAVQLSPGAAPPSLPLAAAEELERRLREHLGDDARTRILPAPGGTKRTAL